MLQVSADHVKDRCWTVPFLAACLSVLFALPQTNGGLFYVMFMEKFGVNREAASWAKTTSALTTCLMGFLIGALQKNVSTYSLILSGAIICPAALIVSSFVPNMPWMCVTFGFIHGVGLGFITIATSMYIVSYFEMYRSFATGLQYLGISLSGVIGPSILSSVATKYGIEGTMLLVGGVTMNLVPLTLLLRHPKPITWHDCRRWKRKHLDEDHMGVKHVVHVHETFLHSTVERGVEDVNTRSGDSDDQKEPKAETTLPEGPDTQRESQIRYSQIPRVPEEDIKKCGVISQVVDVLRTPTFYMILMPIVSADMTLPLFSCTIVDYAGDKGVPLDVAAVLVSCQCAGGFCGRLVIPLISDRTPSGRCAVGSATFLLIAVCFVVMPHVITLEAIAAVTFIAGAQQGYLATIKTVFVADYLGVNKVAVCWGITGFLSMPVLFCQPYIIGAFRDRQGSYDNLYRLCGAVDVVAALILVVQVFLDLRNRRRKGGPS